MINEYNKEERENNTFSLVENMLIEIEQAVDENDKEKLNMHIQKIARGVKNLMTDANFDRILCLVSQFLNNMFTNRHIINEESIKMFNASINRNIEDIIFEKESLLELNHFLKHCEKNNEHNKLPLSYVILVYIFILQNNRKKTMKIEHEIWQCKLNGINYVPKYSDNNKNNFIKEQIQEGIKKLIR